MISEETQKLHQQALEKAHHFRQAEAELIDILELMDQRKGYLELGYSSLFSYAVEALKLSEANASNFICVARKSREIPQLKIEIQKGNLTVSKARKITPLLKQENQKEWLEKASLLTQRNLEKEVARVAPKAPIKERASYVTEDRLRLNLGVSEELMKKLKRAQNLLSQNKRKAVSLEETLEALTEFYLGKKDSVEKAKRQKEKLPVILNAVKNLDPSVDSSFHSEFRFAPPQDDFKKKSYVSQDTLQDTLKRVPLKASLRHVLFLRDEGKCQFKQTQREICGNTRWIHFHHIKPVSQGGKNLLENLITLCSTHHRFLHEQEKKEIFRTS